MNERSTFRGFVELIVRSAANLGNAWRVGVFRAQGIVIGPAVTIGRGARISGQVVIGEGTVVDRDANIRGNVKIGKRCQILVGVDICGNVEIGDGSTIGNYTTLSTLPEEGRLIIGCDVYVNSFSVLGSSLSVTIKDHCIFAPFVQITDASHGIDDSAALTKHSPFKKAPVVLEENVWLGSGVMIMMGVTIGKGSVIGAKSLVSGSIPPFSVAYGIPASVKRERDGA